MILIPKTSDQMRQRGHTLSTCAVIRIPCAYPPASLRFSRLSGLAATELTLSCVCVCVCVCIY